MTECNKCGDCCENIYFNKEQIETMRLTGMTMKGYIPSKDNWEDMYFIYQNWDENDDGSWNCSMFDLESRLCTAHDSRPPVCRGFPWYGREPHKVAIEKYINCSFWADVKEVKHEARF
jgi:Fe-S-cluster containining protein